LGGPVTRRRGTLDSAFSELRRLSGWPADGIWAVITDYATFAYLADIIVVPEFQGHGVGTAIVKAMVEHPQLRGIRLMLLRLGGHPKPAIDRQLKTGHSR